MPVPVDRNPQFLGSGWRIGLAGEAIAGSSQQDDAQGYKPESSRIQCNADGLGCVPLMSGGDLDNETREDEQKDPDQQIGPTKRPLDAVERRSG